MDTESIPENNSDSLVNLINRLVPTLPPLIQPTNPIVREPLPEVLVGSASWHSAFPPQWIPTITQDVGRQRRTVSAIRFSLSRNFKSPSKKLYLFRQHNDHIQMVIYQECHQNVEN